MVLLSSTTDTGAGTNTSTGIRARALNENVPVIFELNVTAAATAAGDTLNVYVQASPDNGTTWGDVVSFTQVLGNGGAKVFFARVSLIVTPTVSTAIAPTDGTLAAGTVNQGPAGSLWRVKRVLVQASAASFTFSVLANGLKRH